MVDIWDLTHSSYAPLSSQPVCLPTAVSYLVPSHLVYGSLSKGAFSFLAAGTAEGVVHLMELPKGVTQPVTSEVWRGWGEWGLSVRCSYRPSLATLQRAHVQELLEREVGRLKYVSQRESARPPPERKAPPEEEAKDEVGGADGRGGFGRISSPFPLSLLCRPRCKRRRWRGGARSWTPFSRPLPSASGPSSRP